MNEPFLYVPKVIITLFSCVHGVFHILLRFLGFSRVECWSCSNILTVMKLPSSRRKKSHPSEYEISYIYILKLHIW